MAKKKYHLRLITSLCPREFGPSTVASLYRLRWQIELFFKECKSFTRLKKFQTKNPHIVEGLIWASMIGILLRRFLLHSAFKDTGKHPSHLASASMTWTFLLTLARIRLHRPHRVLEKELERIFALLERLAQATNRHRETTFDLLPGQYQVIRVVCRGLLELSLLYPELTKL